MAPNVDAIAPADGVLTELGLPSWLDAMLQPGVGDGVFMTLKGTLVGLILVLLTMCYFIEDPEIAFHLYIFTSMAVVLLIIVVWFIGELRAGKLEQPDEKKEGKKD